MKYWTIIASVIVLTGLMAVNSMGFRAQNTVQTVTAVSLKSRTGHCLHLGMSAPGIDNLTDVWHCPVEGKKVADYNPRQDAVVGSYRAHFCSDACQKSFANKRFVEKLLRVETAQTLDKRHPSSRIVASLPCTPLTAEN